jgi:hypothetical protein
MPLEVETMPSELNDRQKRIMAERVKEAARHGVDLSGYEECPWKWHAKFDGHDGRDFDGLFCDGECLVQLTIDIYGNGYMSIAEVDWIHGGEDCECDNCMREMAEATDD